MEKTRQTDRKIFMIVIFISFLMILVYNHFTPMLSDDFSYSRIAQQAGGFKDLILQEYDHYMTHGGRSVAHFMLRCFLRQPPAVFNILNSLSFIALSLAMYALLTHRKKWDWFLYLMIQIGLWCYTVEFEQTVLWETGACNYLWGSMYIMVFAACVHHIYVCSETKKWTPVWILPLGIVAGWCNENTSGGALLYVLLCIFFLIIHGSDSAGRKGKLISLSAAGIGCMTGLLFNVLAPGNRSRAMYSEELHTGILGMMSRFLKITLNLEKHFSTLLAVLTALCVLAILQSAADKESREIPGNRKNTAASVFCRPAMFFLLFGAVSYALIMTTETQPRTFFGAGLFLILSVLEMMQVCLQHEDRSASYMAKWVLYSAGAVLTLQLAFSYLRNGANLVRVYRDCQERIDYILEQKAQGSDDITVAQVHKDFYNDYCAIDSMELSEDPGYWTNVAMEEYYGVSEIRAIPYNEWAVSVGRMTPEEAASAESVHAIQNERIENAIRKAFSGEDY